MQVREKVEVRYKISFYELREKDTQQMITSVKFTGYSSGGKREIAILIFHTNASEFLRNPRLDFSIKTLYEKVKNNLNYVSFL